MNEENVLIRTEADFFKLGNMTNKSTEPGELVNEYILSIFEGKTLEEFLKGFNFTSEEKLAKAINRLVHAVALDLYLNERTNRNEPANKIAFKLADNENPATKEKFSKSKAADLWYNHFAPAIRNKNHKQMFFSQPIDPQKFKEASEKIKDIYGFTDEDIFKLQLFTMQVKESLNYPASDIRVLYLWGQKYCGKTTLGKTIVALANGQAVFKPEYASNLFHELGTTRHEKLGMPSIAIYNCVFMDEAFYKHMNNVYADWKSLVTLDGGVSRLPYGLPIKWKGRANYVLTSNEPLQTFVQDFDDRRYLSIEFKKIPRQMSEDDLMLLMSDFMRNAEYPYGMAQKDFVHYVSGFSNVEGEFSAQRDDVLNVILSNKFLQDLRSRKELQDYNLSLTGIMTIVENCESSLKTHKIGKDVYKAAMVKAFGEPSQKHGWKVVKLIEEIEKAIDTAK